MVVRGRSTKSMWFTYGLVWLWRCHTFMKLAMLIDLVYDWKRCRGLPTIFIKILNYYECQMQVTRMQIMIKQWWEKGFTPGFGNCQPTVPTSFRFNSIVLWLTDLVYRDLGANNYQRSKERTRMHFIINTSKHECK